MAAASSFNESQRCEVLIYFAPGIWQTFSLQDLIMWEQMWRWGSNYGAFLFRSASFINLMLPLEQVNRNDQIRIRINAFRVINRPHKNLSFAISVWFKSIWWFVCRLLCQKLMWAWKYSGSVLLIFCQVNILVMWSRKMCLFVANIRY